MLSAVRQICLSVLLLWPVAAAAEREVHVVSIANGSRDPTDLMSIHEAHVHVDRPDQNVTLVLIDRGPVTWRVTHSTDTFIEDIIIGGIAPARSDLFLSGIPFEGGEIEGLPVTLATLGRPFRDLVARLTDQIGVDRIAGFYGAYDAPLNPIAITQTRALPAFGPDYLNEAIGPVDDLPAAIATWRPTPISKSVVTFDQGGFALSLDDNVVLFEPPPDLPAILFPTGAVYDRETGTIYGMTLGGQGAVFGVDTATGTWRVIGSQDYFDGAQMIFDAAGARIIMTGAFTRPGEIRVMGLDGDARQFTKPATEFVGLTDLYDYGNADAPNLVPVHVDGDWIVLVAGDPGKGAYRAYGVHLGTRDVRLLSFADFP